MKHFVGTTKNGQSVYVDLIHSQAATHITAHPYLLGLVREVLAGVEATGSKLKFEHDLGRVVGYENVVETGPQERVVYAQIMNDDLYSRFTTKGNPSTTQYISIVLEQANDREGYALADAWIGRLKPARPGSKNETKESRDYWSNHAFLLDTQTLQRHTRSEVCPY